MCSTALATALHDPDGRTAAAVERLSQALRHRFAAVAVNATRETAPSAVESFAELMPSTVLAHAADEQRIGTYRRDAVKAALQLGTERILYSDPDHLLRWLEARPDEVDAALGEQADFVVIGRSSTAMAASPRRLQETETVINHIYSLLRPGRRWDLMFAARLMSRTAAELVVQQCQEPTIANDVEWPLVVEVEGLDVDYFAADGLSYRTIHDFDGHDRDRDASPREWIRRVEIAADHAAALRRFL